ncbi:MAG: hypothetical protein KPEEDBHJ_02110 [Anaerolineales bacterium]|nr:hypothetical protein [Anaerolineales bacterium]
MPRIKCHYTDCVFIDEGLCGAAAVELDPDTGCVTYSPTEGGGNDEWEDEDDVDEWEDDEMDGEEDDEWIEEEDEF